jgi:hypothetical protein
MTSHCLKTLLAGLSTAALAACGGGGHDVDPTLISGGGIADPGIDGEVNVYVIDEVSGDPIQGAEVHAGDIEGETDADGLFVAKGDSLSGPTSVTASADDYVTSTWVGANGANVTIPLGLQDEGNITVPQATLEGSITGWESFTPPNGTVKVALVGVSASQDDNDPGNDIVQPPGDMNLCAGDVPCAWSLVSRTGDVTVFAFLGGFDATTETIEITGFAYLDAVTVADGEDQTGIDLTIADTGDLLTTDISLPSPPTGTDTIDAIVEVDLGAGGRLLLPQTGDLQLPVPGTGVFAEASYNVLAVAQTTNGEDGPQSIRFDRAVDVESHSVGTFLAIPTNFETDGAVFSFEPVEGTAVTIFDVSEADGTQWWNVAVFDDSTEVELHEHVAFPSGTLSFRMQGFEAPDIDLEDFAIDDIEDLVTRISADVVEFTN